MRILKQNWPLFLVPVTAVAVFFAYRVMTRDAIEGSAELPRWAAAEPEQSATATARAGEDLNAGRSTGSRRATTPAQAAQRQLQAMSETFRNTTFLIAIRDSGYLCVDLINAEQGADGVPAWRVTCRDALAYFVAVDARGGLVVDPMPYAEGGRTFPVTEGVQPFDPDSRRFDPDLIRRPPE